MKNFYKLIPKEFNTKYHNPGFAKHGINIPFRALIVGSSGSGKTNLLMNLIHIMSGTFEKLIICCKSADEPLYKFVKSKLKNDVEFYEGGCEAIPKLDSLKNCGQTLIVFDDLCNEKDQSVIIDYLIRGRKIGSGISSVYLTQSFFKTPKTVRTQCNYIFLKKVGNKRDLNTILTDNSLNIEKKQLQELYEYCTQRLEDFLLIDVAAPDSKRFRYNFEPICGRS